MSQAATSTATIPSVSGHSESLEDAVAFLEATIWHNPLVCSSCFARLQRRFAGEFQTQTGRLVEVDHRWRTDDAQLGERLEEPPDSIASVQPLARPRTTCTNCGSVGGAKAYDTLSKRAALDRVPALAERLREQGHPVNERAIYAAVARCKSDEDFEAHDKEIFAVAAALGVDRA